MTGLANGRDSVLNQVRDLSQWKKWYPGFENVVLTEELVQDGRVVKATANGIRLAVNESTDSSVVVSMQKAPALSSAAGRSIKMNAMTH